MTRMKLAAPLLILALTSCSTREARPEAWSMSLTTRGQTKHSVDLSPLFFPDLFTTYVEENTPWEATLKAMPGAHFAPGDFEAQEAVREEASASLGGEPQISLISTDYWIETKDGSALDLYDSSWSDPLLQLGAALQEGFVESLAAHDAYIRSRGHAFLSDGSTGPVLGLKFNGLDPWDQNFAASFRVEVHQEEGSSGRFFVQCFGWVGTTHEWVETMHEADSTTAE